MKEFELGHEGDIGVSKSKIFEIVEKAQEDYNIPWSYICEKNGESEE